MLEGWRRDVERARVKQEIRRDKKLAARALGVKPRKIFGCVPTPDGQGLAVYFWPEAGGAWLLRVGYDGIVYGDPVVFENASLALGHMAAGDYATDI